MHIWYHFWFAYVIPSSKTTDNQKISDFEPFPWPDRPKKNFQTQKNFRFFFKKKFFFSKFFLIFFFFFEKKIIFFWFWKIFLCRFGHWKAFKSCFFRLEWWVQWSNRTNTTPADAKRWDPPSPSKTQFFEIHSAPLVWFIKPVIGTSDQVTRWWPSECNY